MPKLIKSIYEAQNVGISIVRNLNVQEEKSLYVLELGFSLDEVFEYLFVLVQTNIYEIKSL